MTIKRNNVVIYLISILLKKLFLFFPTSNNHRNTSATLPKRLKFENLFLYYLYIYPPDLQESDGGANILSKQLPQPASGDAKILLSG